MSRQLDFSDGFTSNAASSAVSTAASSVSNTPSGNLASTDVQAALNELQTDIDTRATSSALSSAQALDLKIASNLSDLNDAATARTNLSLGNVDNTSDATKNAAVVTLTNKTLTSPIISTISNTGTLTLPTSTDTLVGKATTDTLTNKTLTSPVINSPTGIVKGDVGLGNVDNTSDATKNSASATLTNKTLTAPIIDVISATEQGSAPANPSAGTRKMYVKTDGLAYLLDSTGAETPLGSGGSGSKNYFASSVNSGSSIGTFAAYLDAAGTIPVDMTGGSPNAAVTFATSTSSPLTGSNSIIFLKDANDRQGTGYSIDLTMDASDKGKVLAFSMNYAIASGTYADDDVVVYFYDATNSALIQSAPYKIKNHTLTSDRYFAEVQVPYNCSTLRFGFHISSPSNSAYSLKFDDLLFGPQAKLYGSPITDWVSFTPSVGAGWGTISSYTARYRRVGDSAEIEYKFTAGSTTGGSSSINLPGSFVIDSTKVPSSQVMGYLQNNINADNTRTMIGTGGNNYIELGRTYTSSSLTAALAPNNIGTGMEIQAQLLVPIQGWSSSQLMSSDASTRVIAARATGQPASASAGNPVIFPTTTYDDVGAYNATTGRYTVQVPGTYRISFMANASSASELYKIYKNASADIALGSSNSAGQASGSGSVRCIAGDIIDVRPINAGSGGHGTGGFISFELISGPAQISASDSITARYYASATSISGSLATIVWTTKDYDSHGGMSSGVFTVPSSGKYMVTSAITIDGTYSLNATIVMEIQKNGVSITRNRTIAGAANSSQDCRVTDVINCVAGDTLRVQASSAASGPAIPASNTANYMTVLRVGNY